MRKALCRTFFKCKNTSGHTPNRSYVPYMFLQDFAPVGKCRSAGELRRELEPSQRATGCQDIIRKLEKPRCPNHATQTPLTFLPRITARSKISLRNIPIRTAKTRK